MARLVPTVTQTKCLICRSPRREEADRYIAALGQKDGNGTIVTWEHLTKNVMPLLLGRASIGTSSLRRHRANHCRLVEDDELGDDAAIAADWENDPETQALLAEIDSLAAQNLIAPSAVLNIQQRLYLMSLRRKIANGERVEVTHDVAARAADKLSQNEKTHEQAQLLGALAGGIELAFKRSFPLGFDDDETAELNAGEIIEDAEVVEGETG